jgi:putative ABC transport system permease protein
MYSEGNSSRTGTPDYVYLDKHIRTLPQAEAVSVYSVTEQVQTFSSGMRETLFMKRTDGFFWQILDFEFIEGGPFTEIDNEQAAMVAVINETTRNRLVKKDQAVGETIQVDEQTFRVVGVVKDVSFLRLVPFSDVWVPLRTAKAPNYFLQEGGAFWAIILAKDRADIPAIKQEVRAQLPFVELPSRFDTADSRAETLLEFQARTLFGEDEAGRPFRLFLAIGIFMLLFMLLPAINLVNLNVSRIMERVSEIGVRKAFGASSWTLVGQFVVENLLLTGIGGLIGLGMAYGVLGLLSAGDLILYGQFVVNLRIFFYTLLLVFAFGLLSGVYPAWRMSRLHPAEALSQ